jgi:hypothetical protein
LHARTQRRPALNPARAVAEAVAARYGVETMKALADLTDAAQVDAMMETILAQMGTIDIRPPLHASSLLSGPPISHRKPIVYGCTACSGRA